MNKSLIVALSFLCALPSCAFAQQAAYQFTAPHGWKGIDKDNVLIFVPPEPPVDAIIHLLPVQLPTGDLQKQAISVFNGWAKTMVDNPGPPQVRRDKAKNGAEYVVASAIYPTPKSGDVFLTLLAREEKGAVGIMLFFAKNINSVKHYASDSLEMFESLHLTDEAAKLAAAQARGGSPGKSRQ